MLFVYLLSYVLEVMDVKHISLHTNVQYQIQRDQNLNMILFYYINMPNDQKCVRWYIKFKKKTI